MPDQLNYGGNINIRDVDDFTAHTDITTFSFPGRASSANRKMAGQTVADEAVANGDISALTELAAADPANDLLLIRDVSAGENKVVNPNNLDLAAMTAANTSSAGTKGQVPQPPADSQNKLLRGDATFGVAIPAWTNGTVYEIGDVIYDSSDNKIYRCTTAHTASGSLNGSNFTELSSGGSVAYDSLTSGTVTAAVTRIGGTSTTISNPGSGQYTLTVQSGADFQRATVYGNNTTLNGSNEMLIRVNNSANSRDRRVMVQLYDASNGALVDQQVTGTNHTQTISGNVTLLTIPGLNGFGSAGFYVEIR